MLAWLPVIVDAGIGRPSQACECMETGAAAVLANTAIASAGDPVAMARHWADLGALWLHIVDLDGAFSGMPRNFELIKNICAGVPVPVQLGGGIRDAATAAAYLSQGNFCWNAGMFVWSIPTVCEQLDKHCPELASFVEHIAESPDPQETIREEFPALTPISIDFALMENADRVLNIEATFDWDDVGSWISVANYLETHNKNTTNTDITVQDASGNIVFSQRGDKHVALLGVENLIVVETADAILIADKNKADEIKKIVNQLPDELR